MARASNYERMQRRMAGAFLAYDQGQMIARYGLAADEAYLYLTFVGLPCRIGRATGQVEHRRGGVWAAADYNEAMALYDFLCYARPGCRAAGECVSLQSLSTVATGSVPPGGGLLDQAARALDGRADRLDTACRRLGGTPAGRGDVAFRIPVFGELAVVFQFWRADEEFPASIQFLCDRNILQFLHYETVWFLLSHIVRRLEEETAS